MDKEQSSQSSFEGKYNIKMIEGLQDDKSNNEIWKTTCKVKQDDKHGLAETVDLEVKPQISSPTDSAFKSEDDREMKDKNDVTGSISDPSILAMNTKPSCLWPVDSKIPFTTDKNKIIQEENHRLIVPNLIASSRKVDSAISPSSFPRESLADSSDLHNLAAEFMSIDFRFRPDHGQNRDQNTVATLCGEATDENIFQSSTCTVIRENQSHPCSIPKMVYDLMNGSDQSESHNYSGPKWIGQPCKNKTLEALNKKLSKNDFDHKAMKTEKNTSTATIQNLPDLEQMKDIPVCKPKVQQVVHRNRKLTNPNNTPERGKVTKSYNFSELENMTLKTESQTSNASSQNFPVVEPKVQQSFYRKRKLTNPHNMLESGKVTKFDHSLTDKPE